MLNDTFITLWHNEKQRRIDTIIHVLTPSLKEALTEKFQELAEASPQYDNFRFSMYRPYFNDGDECVYRIDSVTFDNTGTELELSYEEDGWDYFEGEHHMYSFKYHNGPAKDSPYKPVYDFLKELDQFLEIFEEVLGAVVVTYTRNAGLKIEDIIDHE